MERFLEDWAAQLVIWVALCAILVVVAVYVIGRVRAEPVQQEPKASELISKFRDLHAKGELSEEEFRTIKTNLAVRFQEELNDNDETG